MTDLLFGQSYFLRFDPKLYAGMQPYPPLGTLYAAAVAREAGYSVALFDAMLAESEQEWAAALDGTSPRFAVLFEDNFNYLSKMCLGRMREAAFCMIRMAVERGATVLVCGADATDHAARYLQAGAHWIIRGEGEQTLVELLDALTGKTAILPEAIPGLAFTGSEGQLVQTLPRAALRDLDSLPFPAWDLVDIAVAAAPRLLQRQHGDHARLSLFMQLVCQADLGPALQRAQPGKRGCGDENAGRNRPARSSLVRR
jgi:anaerobic magnesium-protoporphyrin IX monomethyl ester cyclase